MNYRSRNQTANMIGKRAAELMTLANETRQGGEARDKQAMAYILNAVRALNAAEAALRDKALPPFKPVVRQEALL